MKEEKADLRVNILVILLLVYQVSSLGILNRIVLLGRPITAYIRYVIFLITLINLGLYIYEERKDRLICTWFLISFVFTGIIGFINTGNIMNVLIEASHYVTIVSLYFWVANHEYTVKKVIRLVYILIPILLATSILSSFGFLNGMKDSSGGLLRSSVDVDGTIGVVATLTAFHVISSKRKASVLDYCEFLMGCLIVFFSLSRGRIAILLLCIVIYLLTIARSNNSSKIRKVIPLIILVFLFMFLFSNFSSRLIDQIVSRFIKTTRDESNITNRGQEILRHLEIFRSQFLFGYGWGMLSRYQLHDHCSYSAVLAYMGIIGGIPYLCWFFWHVFYTLVKAYKEPYVSNYHLSFITIFAIMALAVANMAFNKTGGVWGMLISYTAFLDQSSQYKEQDVISDKRKYKYIKD